MDENIYRAMEGYRQLLGRVEAMEAREGNREIRLSTLEAACRAELAARSQPAERAGVPYACPQCGGLGWYADRDPRDPSEPVQVQCEVCEGGTKPPSRAQALAPGMVAVRAEELEDLRFRVSSASCRIQTGYDAQIVATDLAELMDHPALRKAAPEGSA